jgi:hypothetical protein
VITDSHLRSVTAATAPGQGDGARYRSAPTALRPHQADRPHRPATSREVVHLPSAIPAVIPAAAPARPGEQGPGGLPRTGLNLPRQMPFDRWLNIGRTLAVTASSSAWCLGDWLIYGEACYSGRYRDAIERTSLEYKTLRNYAWVARKFRLERRHEALSFGHHAEVAALPEPEQDFWLRKAEGLGWSRNDLRREVHTSLRERQDGPALVSAGGDADADSAFRALQLDFTPEQLEVIGQAASKARLAVDAWATATLERAALQEVNS